MLQVAAVAAYQRSSVRRFCSKTDLVEYSLSGEADLLSSKLVARPQQHSLRAHVGSSVGDKSYGETASRLWLHA